jgi:hypothetical protein
MPNKERIGQAIKEMAMLVNTQQSPNDSVNINVAIGELFIELVRATQEPPVSEIGYEGR